MMASFLLLTKFEPFHETGNHLLENRKSLIFQPLINNDLFKFKNSLEKLTADANSECIMIIANTQTQHK
jgi:hypothetical protein